jgi:hypothetical protein
MFIKGVLVALCCSMVVNISFATDTNCIDFDTQAVCFIENNAGDVVDSFVVDNN